jgi:PAS domain-containing protein
MGAALGQASPQCAIWNQVVDRFPAPIAVADRCGSIVAANRAFRRAIRIQRTREAMRLDERESCLAAAISCAASSQEPVVCRCGVASEICFECRRLDEGGLVALIGRVA